MEAKTKRCTKCGESKPISEFTRSAQSEDGYFWRCKECKNAYQRKDYAKHRGERLLTMRRWREQNPEKATEAEQRWRRSERGREVRGRLQAEYAERWPERVLANARAQEMKRRGKEALQVEAKEYIQILKQDRCSYCGERVQHMDHIASRAEGGVEWNHWTNFTAACQRCNNRKYQKPLLLFLLEGPHGESNPAGARTNG